MKDSNTYRWSKQTNTPNILPSWGCKKPHLFGEILLEAENSNGHSNELTQLEHIMNKQNKFLGDQLTL